MEQTSEQKNVIITFANQKGGVGKSTLCALFANYLITKGKSILIVDCDIQQSICDARKRDLSKNADTEIQYNVKAFSIFNPQNVSNLMSEIHSLEGIFLIDAPGNLSQNGLLPIYQNTDYIVCPFSYDDPTLKSTNKFIDFLIKNEMLRPERTFYIPNNFNPREGLKEELVQRSVVEKLLNKVGMVTPRVARAADMKRFKTIGFVGKQVQLTTPAFDFMYNTIFNKPNEE